MFLTKFYLKMTLSVPTLTNTVDTFGPGVLSYVYIGHILYTI